MRTFPLRTILIAGTVVLAIILLLSYRAACTRADTAKDQATLGDARTTSAQEAITIIGENTAANTATQAEVQEAQDAIRQAAPADRDRVARRELCQLQGRSPC